MRSRAQRLLVPAAWVAGVTAVLLLVFPLGFPNYDTIYALLWGREIADGVSPDMGAALPPTPHPLAELYGAVAAPLGSGVVDLTIVLAYISLGLIGYLVYRLGSLWFDQPIGAVAALIVLTRAPYLSNGLRAYVDLPYIALVLGALLVETRSRLALEGGNSGTVAPRQRVAWRVLALLALAGLLRPEAWLFSIAYLAYLALEVERGKPALKLQRPGSSGAGTVLGSAGSAERVAPGFAIGRIRIRRRPGLGGGELFKLAALALAAPLAWALFDWITAGSPLYSLTGTQQTVETLKRQTGPVDLVLYGPRRLGEVLQWPGMVGATGGVALGLAFLRRRSWTGAVAAALALGAFALLACAGLAIIPRYTMLAAAVLAIFAALALLGWRLLERGHPWRRRWQLLAGIVVAMFVIWGPNQWSLDSTVNRDLTNQGAIERDLTGLVDAGAFVKPLCGPIAVPNHRAVPRLAFSLDVKPTRIVSATEAGKEEIPRRGYFLDPAGPFVIHNFILDPNDRTRFPHTVPRGFRRVAGNESWVLYQRC